jgi:protein O-mannosyl-transferase
MNSPLTHAHPGAAGSPPSGSRAPRPAWRWGAALLLLALTVAAYLPALRGGFIWDDSDYVTQNLNLRDAAGLGRIWTNPTSDWQYYPLVFTTFWAEYHAWGLNPLGYHLDNVILQAIAALLLWRLLVRLGLAEPAAWLAAAIFAIHPVQVESVAWVSERKNVLCGVFFFAALLVYFNGDAQRPRLPSRATYAAALALFLGAMFSKTVAATWPAAVLVLIWWRSGRVRRRDVLPLIPFFILAILMGLLTAQLERQQVGASGKDWDLGGLDRCIIAGRALWFYAAKAIWPSPLAFIYPKWNLHAHRGLQIAVAASAAAVLIGLVLLSGKIGRAPAAAGLLFAGLLAPALGFVNFYPMRYSFVADHFEYLAIAALIVPIAALAWRWGGRWAWVLLAPLLLLTWQQCGFYHDPVTLWTNTASLNGGWMVHENLGQAWEARGRLDLAERQYRAAVAAGPNEPDPWWKLGAFLAGHGHYAQAEADFRHALKIDPNYTWAKEDLDKVLKLEKMKSR